MARTRQWLWLGVLVGIAGAPLPAHAENLEGTLSSEWQPATSIEFRAWRARVGASKKLEQRFAEFRQGPKSGTYAYGNQVIEGKALYLTVDGGKRQRLSATPSAFRILAKVIRKQPTASVRVKATQSPNGTLQIARVRSHSMSQIEGLVTGSGKFLTWGKKRIPLEAGDFTSLLQAAGATDRVKVRGLCAIDERGNPTRFWVTQVRVVTLRLAAKRSRPSMNPMSIQSLVGKGKQGWATRRKDGHFAINLDGEKRTSFPSFMTTQALGPATRDVSGKPSPPKKPRTGAASTLNEVLGS